MSLELAGVPALPFAVGMYLPHQPSTPIFVGGMLRWVADRVRGVSASEAEAETSPGVLLSSGYIAGGTLVRPAHRFPGVPAGRIQEFLDLSRLISHWGEDDAGPKIVSLIAFGIIGAVLLWIGTRKSTGIGVNGR